MNYNDMIRNRDAFQALSIHQIEKICALNEKLKQFEKNIARSAIEVDKLLRIQVEDSNDLLIDYDIICEISFPIVPKQKYVSPIRSWPCISITGSDWTEKLKGISTVGSKLDNDVNYNSFFGHGGEIGGLNHCWLFHILYAEFYMSWEDICRISAIWTDLEVVHHYCSEL